jgi:hypothetical protein
MTQRQKPIRTLSDPRDSSGARAHLIMVNLRAGSPGSLSHPATLAAHPEARSPITRSRSAVKAERLSQPHLSNPVHPLKTDADNEELFPVVVTLSPRLQWVAEHQIRVHYCAGIGCGGLPWCAWLPSNDDVIDIGPHDALKHGGLPIDPDACGYGHTEIEALEQLATIHRLRHWSIPPAR